MQAKTLNAAGCKPAPVTYSTEFLEASNPYPGCAFGEFVPSTEPTFELSGFAYKAPEKTGFIAVA